MATRQPLTSPGCHDVMTDSRRPAPCSGRQFPVSTEEPRHGYFVAVVSGFARQPAAFRATVLILRAACLNQRVRPLALSRRAAQCDRSWISELGGDSSLVTLSAHASGAALALRQQLDAQQGRFVAIIDPQLTCRGLLHYRPEMVGCLSPLDLLAAVDVLRRRCEAIGGRHQLACNAAFER